MTTQILRRLWCVVGQSHPSYLLNSSESELVSHLAQCCNADASLTLAELQELKTYIRLKVTLIQDLASHRLVHC